MSMRHVKFPAMVLALLATGFSVAAQASTNDRKLPMDIEAAHQICGFGANDTCTLTGKVSIAQGTLNVTAAKAIIEQSVAA
jgi:lipopolysaccharide export system protein LptA